ncbi:MAG: hypothetical protein ACLTDV_06550 [Eubacterium sp.]
MQRTKKRPDSMPGFQIGTSYLLVIFIILCLVTFAALALSSALRDQSYSQALAKHQTEYAAASTQASALLAQIDEALESETTGAGIGKLPAGTVPAISVSVQRQNAERPVFEITALIPVSDSQNLQLTVSADAASHTRRITAWRETAVSGWEEQTTLPVLGSDRTEND